MVASGTRKARAISAVVRPPTARSVSASCDAGDSAGWQQRNSSVKVSSPDGPASTSGTGVIATSASSRRRRASSLRSASVRRRDATVSNHALGLAGQPSTGHWRAAASNASCTASSHRSKCP